MGGGTMPIAGHGNGVLYGGKHIEKPLTGDRILWRLRCGTPWRDVPLKYGNWNTIYRRFRRWSEAGVWEAVSVTLAEIMADSGHYSIDSTTVRAHVSAAGGKGGLIDALLAARGAGSPVSFTVWQMPADDRSPST